MSALTPHQFRVLMMLGEGLLNKQIAYQLGVSEATIKAHVTAILRKMQVTNRTQAVLAVQRLNTKEPGLLWSNRLPRRYCRLRMRDISARSAAGLIGFCSSA